MSGAMGRLVAGMLAAASAAAVLVAPGSAARSLATAGGSPAAGAPQGCQLPGVVRADSYGSGDFGRWAADRYGLPVYLYDASDRARSRPALEGVSEAASQLGNDNVVADAYGHGYVQLWDQDQAFEWANSYDGSARHYTGGYGYLRVGGQTISTRYDDRPAGASAARAFGTGYFWQCTRAAGMLVNQYVYAPFGSSPLLLHDVVLRNLTGRAREVTWYEYWDVNPLDQQTEMQLGLAAPRYHAALRALTVAQAPVPQARQPLTIFAAAIHAPVAGFDTSVGAFFGHGSRQEPAEVTANRASDSIAPPAPAGETPGHTLLVLRSPVRLPAHNTVTLRYAYGIASAKAIPGLVHRYQAQADPLAASSRRWRAYLPSFSVPGQDRWLGRELTWDAYMLRSGATYNGDCHHDVIAQGGYYQYGIGWQGGYRAQLQIMLPMIYTDPALARQILLYSAQEQNRVTGAVPQLMFQYCQPSTRTKLVSDDLSVWLMLAASEYGLATRDFRFFGTQVPFRGGGHASLWDHLKLAFRYQESWRGPHGEYRAGLSGDWADGSVQFLGMRESDLVTAQLAYIYPRLAQLAGQVGDQGFADRLNTRARQLLRTVRENWVSRGWYARGWGKTARIGLGAIFGEPQPWAILAGAPDRSQAGRLVANIRYYLTGVGAPGGPSKIGSSQSPARDDPGVTEHSGGTQGTRNAVYIGDSWYDIDGWLTWALGTLDGTVPHASSYAFSEFVRNTLATHAHVFPRQWVGVLSSDDVCNAYYEKTPSACGLPGLVGSRIEGQNMEPPAWTVFDAVKLAGIEPVAAGYVIDPQLPLRNYSLKLPTVGVTSGAHQLNGYLRLVGGYRMTLAVRVGASTGVTAYVDRRRVPAQVSGRFARFAVTAAAGQELTWKVTW